MQSAHAAREGRCNRYAPREGEWTVLVQISLAHSGSGTRHPSREPVPRGTADRPAGGDGKPG